MFKKIALVVALAFSAMLCGVPQNVQAQAFSGSCAQIRGSFTGTLTGFSAGTAGTFQYKVTQACTVIIWSTASLVNTSNAATMTLTGAPYNIAPASTMSTQFIPSVIEDNGSLVFGCSAVSNTTPVVITFSNSGLCTGVMTSTGIKGMNGNWIIQYQLY
jgi:hypothetical protein